MQNVFSRLDRPRIEAFRANILTLANQLTLLRIGFVPVFIILLVYDRLGWALLVFLAAGLTDGLDGIIARRFGQKTSVGAVLDPLADKLLMTSSIIVLSLPQMEFPNPVPLWLMLLVIFRDVFILMGSLIFILIQGFQVFPPTMAGKISTALQLTTLFSVLFYNWMNVEQPALLFLFILTGVATVISGFQYLVIGRKLVEPR